ncbi:hypothetical protein [Arenimonas terrae]|uniref:Uncharacterized protein n=1 Tax=Arenimonas terrae TaxID=2546226 RepID=A0A5C4RV98_9GAMM|nr:hypothetical protein [Arenimonas terrae]TNJ34928.1 hypothetical protein E1B00_03885 [Arenimonas terrae]
MTQPQDPRQSPLQDDEIALARVLRALPAGEPSAKVDAAILAAATDAVNGAATPAAPASPRRAVKTTRWLLPGWAIGTAAAAVLAVGVGMQLRPPLAPEPQAASAERASEAPAARDEVSVELVDPQERKVLPTAPPPDPVPDAYERPGRAPPPPPPPPPPPVAQSAPAPVAEAAEAVPMPAAAEPAPAPEADAATLDSIEVTGSRVRTPAESGDHARRAHQAAYATRAQREAAAKSEAQADRAFAEAQAREESLRERQAEARSEAALAAPAAPVVAAPAPPSVSDAGAGARDDAAAALPPVADDRLLAPREWLERIRERLRQGDRAGARASLLLFVQAHPDAPVPTDLDRLR